MSAYLDQLRAETDAAVANCVAALERMNDCIQQTNTQLAERQKQLRTEVEALGLPNDIPNPRTPA